MQRCHVTPTCVLQVIEVSRGSTLYRINDPSDAFFVIVEGSVTLFDARDKDESTEGGSMTRSRDGVTGRRGMWCCRLQTRLWRIVGPAERHVRASLVS